MTKPGSIGYRVVAALVTVGVTFVLLSLLLQFAGTPVNAGHYEIALASSCILAFLVTRQAASVCSAGFVTNGLLGIGVVTGLLAQGDIWVGQSSYNDDIDRAVGSLAPFIWVWAMRVGIVAALLAALWVAFSYWLARSHGRVTKPTL